MDPPGAYVVGVHGWQCCGPCAIDLPTVSILYFSTAEVTTCTSWIDTITPDGPVSSTPDSVFGTPRYAVVDGSTL